MIQRVQTIFLILAAGCFGALFKMPLATSSVSSAHFLADNVYSIQDHLALLSVTILAAGVSVLTIFLFKNRKLQRKLVYLIAFLAIILVIASYLLLKMDNQGVIQSLSIQLQAGTFLPMAGIVFCMLAGYYIGKDEKLVKSMDRLR
jgi:hypothetical protein